MTGVQFMELLVVARNIVRDTRGSTTDKQNTPILDLVARLPDVFSEKYTLLTMHVYILK